MRGRRGRAPVDAAAAAHFGVVVDGARDGGEGEEVFYVHVRHFRALACARACGAVVYEEPIDWARVGAVAALVGARWDGRRRWTGGRRHDWRALRAAVAALREVRA